MEYTFRNIEEKDYPEVCRLPQTEGELYFMFPKADFPLTIEQFSENLKTRFSPTVFLENNIIVGFANFYNIKQNENGWLGNVIVHPACRGKGVGRFIVSTMEQQAVSIYNIQEMNISCFNDNLPALLLYHRLGYIPFGTEKRWDKYGKCHILINMKKRISQQK